jgi:SAM-dependent methyltransferase
MSEQIEVAGSDTSAPINMEKRLRLLSSWTSFQGLRLLDAGCGAGAFVEEAARRGADVRGIEYQEDKVEDWERRHPGDGRVQRGDLAALDFPDASFDAVLNNEVLEHVPDDKLALREMARVLKPGGLLFLFTPNRFYPVESHGYILRHSGEHVSGMRGPFLPWLPIALAERRVRFWARNYWPGQLRRMVREAGFTVEQHTFVWQTFEGISGGKPKLIHRVAPLARTVANIAEAMPLIRMFGCSQLIVARKPKA